MHQPAAALVVRHGRRVACAVLLALGGCDAGPTPNDPALPTVATPARTAVAPGPASVLSAAPDVDIVPIPLAAVDDEPGAAIAGMAWMGRTLVLLPRHPADGAGAGGQLYGVEGAAIEAFLDRRFAGPLEIQRLTLDAPGLEEAVGSFGGFEAVAFAPGRDGLPVAYLAVRGTDASGHRAYVVQADVAPGDDGPVITTLPGTAVPIDAPRVDDMTVEALVPTSTGVLALFAANGANVNAHPEAVPVRATTARVETRAPLAAAEPVPFPALEYRLTGATALDREGRFWVTNTFAPEDASALDPGLDTLADAYGESPSHTQSALVERLVQLTVTGEGIDLVADQPPIQLRLAGNGARRWAGVARLRDRGFLIGAEGDGAPLLAYVPGI